jgi:VanZ family protein
VSEWLRRWGPALLFTAILFAASSRPTLPVDLHSGSDKLVHFAAYSVLGVLLARGQLRSGVSAAWVILVGILIGGLDELYQSTIPNRSTDALDWLADSLGVVFGVFVFNLWWRARTREGRPARHVEPLPNE